MGLDLRTEPEVEAASRRELACVNLDPTPGSSFAYKVQSLTVQFANSAISGFASRVALLAPRLFGSTVTLRDTTGAGYDISAGALVVTP